jgi:hypothetical protein
MLNNEDEETMIAAGVDAAKDELACACERFTLKTTAHAHKDDAI